jgi:hypothetical protein
MFDENLLKKLMEVFFLSESFVKNDRLYDLFMNQIGSGPLDGGCYAMAMGLKNVYGGELITLEGSTRTSDHVQGQHVLLKKGDRYIDADGVSSEQEILNRWQKEEGIIDPALRPYQDGDVPESPRSETLINFVTEFLEKDSHAN